MQPAFDPRPWGTLDLSPIYPNHRFEEKIGEAWLTGDACKVANGPLSGQSLSELSSKYGRELVGEAPADPNRFPLLLKFLFPTKNFPCRCIQTTRQPAGWGSPGARPNAGTWPTRNRARRLGWASKPGVTRDQFERAITEKRAEELLNWVNVYPGEMIYVAGGTVHTLGPGAIIVETQQQSDTTYRLYDYGRPRELHLKEGLAAIKEKVGSGKVVRPAPSNLNGGANRRAPLISSPYFVVEMFELKQPHSFRDAERRRKNVSPDSGGGGRLRNCRSCRRESGYAGQR